MKINYQELYDMLFPAVVNYYKRHYIIVSLEFSENFCFGFWLNCSKILYDSRIINFGSMDLAIQRFNSKSIQPVTKENSYVSIVFDKYESDLYCCDPIKVPQIKILQKIVELAPKYNINQEDITNQIQKFIIEYI